MSAKPDRDQPQCPCGCHKIWCDEFHSWLCPHCDLKKRGRVIHKIGQQILDRVDVMTVCSVCGNHSGRLEVCTLCAPMIWPRQVINEGAKRLSQTLLGVATSHAGVSP